MRCTDFLVVDISFRIEFIGISEPRFIVVCGVGILEDQSVPSYSSEWEPDQMDQGRAEVDKAVILSAGLS